MAGYDKDVVQIIRKLKKKPYNCTVTEGRSGHYRVFREGYRAITITGTPGDVRALKNIKCDIRRDLGIVL